MAIAGDGDGDGGVVKGREQGRGTWGGSGRCGGGRRWLGRWSSSGGRGGNRWWLWLRDVVQQKGKEKGKQRRDRGGTQEGRNRARVMVVRWWCWGTTAVRVVGVVVGGGWQWWPTVVVGGSNKGAR
ncbi:hypothetical protein SOVF_085700, partial [Spinacia oleracea]